MDYTDAILFVFYGWLALTVGSFALIRLYVRRRGEPSGWRFNHHGASAFPGHLSFYERGGGRAVVLKSVRLFPLYWKVQRTPSEGEYLNLETVKRAPAWTAIQWAYRYMGNATVVSILTGENSE